MAAVINLDTVRLTRQIEDKPAMEAVSAEIILFPGIRYERWDDEAHTSELDASDSQFNVTPSKMTARSQD